MTGISASAKQGAVTTLTFCTSVASLADAVCGITENAAQVIMLMLIFISYYYYCY